MTISIYGALRSDTTMTTDTATYATVGSTFEISAYSQLTFEDGADPTVIAGDSITNETPNDPTQTMAGNAIAWDYTVTVSDGVTNYEIGLVDYDLDGDGSFDWPTNEQGFFIAFIGAIPPLNTQLTVDLITDNGASIPVDSVVPCFAENTLISTPSGAVRVQDLKKGDCVQTLDHGEQIVRWIRLRRLDQADFQKSPMSRPIRIETGALGEGLPWRVLRVSPQHRMMVNSPIAEKMFGEREAFLPANKLVGLPGISVDDAARNVEYHHILLDRHEVLLAEGAPTESFYLGPIALQGVSNLARLEINALFQQIGKQHQTPKTARPMPNRGRLSKRLVSRHLKNGKPIISSAYRGLPQTRCTAIIAEQSAMVHAKNGGRRLQHEPII